MLVIPLPSAVRLRVEETSSFAVLLLLVPLNELIELDENEVDIDIFFGGATLSAVFVLTSRSDSAAAAVRVDINAVLLYCH